MKLYERIGSTQLVIILLTVISAVIHFTLPAALFKLNALGFLGLLVLYFVRFDFLPFSRGLIRWGLIAFTAVTFIAYFVMRIANNYPIVEFLGLFTKAIEAVLIVLLVRDGSSQSGETVGA